MAVITFLGDINLANISTKTDKISISKSIQNILNRSDIVIGNIEFTVNTGEMYGGEPRLVCSEKDLQFLSEFNLNIGLLANNHIFDSGKSGFLKLKSWLEDKNILTVGAGISENEASLPSVIHEKKMIIYNYVDENTHPVFDPKNQLWVNEYNKEKVVKDLKQYSIKGYFNFITVHSGCQKYYLPEPHLIDNANLFITNGAHGVIFNHAHSVQPYTVGNDLFVHYGLGNLFFGPVRYYSTNHDSFHEKQPVRRERFSVIIQLAIKEHGMIPNIFYTHQKQNSIVLYSNILFMSFMKILSLAIKTPFYSLIFLSYRFWREIIIRTISLFMDSIRGKRKFSLSHLKRLNYFFSNFLFKQGDL